MSNNSKHEDGRMFISKSRTLTPFGSKQLSATYHTHTHCTAQYFWHERSDKFLVTYFSALWNIDATMFFTTMCTGCDDWVHRKDRQDSFRNQKPNNRPTTNPISYKYVAPE